MSADQPDLLDVLSGRADRHDVEAAARKLHRQRVASFNGPPLDRRWERCGRCGVVDYVGTVATSHDLGYLGCPNEVDPTWSKYPVGPGFRTVVDPTRTSSHLTESEMDDRWDRRLFPVCGCGHGWGLHRDGQGCYLYCGCRVYQGVC